MILIMLLSLAHLFLQRLYKIASLGWWGDGLSTSLSLLVTLNIPTFGSTPALPCTPKMCYLPRVLWQLGEKHTS